MNGPPVLTELARRPAAKAGNAGRSHQIQPVRTVNARGQGNAISRGDVAAVAATRGPCPVARPPALLSEQQPARRRSAEDQRLAASSPPQTNRRPHLPVVLAQ